MAERVCASSVRRGFLLRPGSFFRAFLPALALLMAPHGQASPLVTSGVELALTAHPQQNGPAQAACLADKSRVDGQDGCAARSAMVEVPEPAPLILVGAGLLSIAALVRNKTVR